MDGRSLANRAEEAHSGGIRAAVLGVNDGLSTNIALILGVAGASADPALVKIAGVASLVAGACSMAVGEFISMTTQVELFERVMREVRATMTASPEKGVSMVGDALVRFGLDEGAARRAADELRGQDERMVRLYAATAFGIASDGMGSPWFAAIASLVTFAIGAAVPLLPWFLLSSAAAGVSIAAGIAAAFVVGAFLGNYTDGRWFRGGVRQVAFIALASGITYGVGRLFRVAL
jgi:vacuolar iron transporter family protein